MDDSTDPLALVGTTVADTYEIVAVAGAGGFSVVYRANHLVEQQPVAFKIFNVLDSVAPELCEKLLADFIQEGQLINKLSSRSPTFVQARETGKHQISAGEWLPYLVLEWLEGDSLVRVLARERKAGMAPRTLQEAMALLEPVATALDIAHCNNVAHRDLKPANIMILGDARQPGAVVKLLDFGIAKVMAEHEELQAQLLLTGKRVTAFTPTYGAPEQFSRTFGATGPWTDVYAMALILLELMQGERVLKGDTYFELGTASSDEGKRPTPHALGLAVSAGVEAVFAKAVAVQPKNRFPSMAELWSALRAQALPSEHGRRAAGGEPVSGSEPSTISANDSAAAAPRGNSMVALIAALVVVLAGGLWLCTQQCSSNVATPTPPRHPATSSR